MNKIKRMALILLAITCMMCAVTPVMAGKKKSHKHCYTTYVSQPTCTKNGYTCQRCSCGATKNKKTLSKLGHNYGPYIPAGAWIWSKCRRCGHMDSKPYKPKR